LSPSSHVAGIGAGIELILLSVSSADHGGGKSARRTSFATPSAKQSANQVSARGKALVYALTFK
jgi:hypothetical protein